MKSELVFDVCALCCFIAHALIAYAHFGWGWQTLCVCGSCIIALIITALTITENINTLERRIKQLERLHLDAIPSSDND